MVMNADRRYKATLADMEVEHRGQSYGQGYNSSSSSNTDSTRNTSKMTVDYNNLGMPTPPLSPKPGKKRTSLLSWIPWGSPAEWTQKSATQTSHLIKIYSD